MLRLQSRAIFSHSLIGVDAHVGLLVLLAHQALREKMLRITLRVLAQIMPPRHPTIHRGRFQSAKQEPCHFLPLI